MAESIGGPICQSCGAPGAPGKKFCAACGQRLDASAKGRPQTHAFAAQQVQIGADLVLLDEGGKALARHAIEGEEITIGRGEANIAFPDDPLLSPLHAKITIRDGQLLVRDLGSRNNTWYYIEEPYKLLDGDLLLIGSQVMRFRRLGYPGPHPPEHDDTRRMGSLTPAADIACLTQLRSDGSERDVLHLSPGRNITVGRERGDWIFPYDASMSGTHAQFRSEDADFVVIDAGSRNGVAIAVRGEITLRNGSRILVGDKMLRLETS